MRANLAFNALFFSLVGWGSLQAALFIAGAGVGSHLLACALGLAFSATAFHRCRVWWPSLTNAGVTAGHSAANRSSLADVSACIALIAAGGILALSAKTGSVALISLFAAVFNLVPWSRMSYCGKHFFISHALLDMGAVTILYIAAQDIMFYFASAWIFWLIAASDLLATLKRDRQAGARPDSIQGVAPLSPEHEGSSSTQ